MRFCRNSRIADLERHVLVNGKRRRETQNVYPKHFQWCLTSLRPFLKIPLMNSVWITFGCSSTKSTSPKSVLRLHGKVQNSRPTRACKCKYCFVIRGNLIQLFEIALSFFWIQHFPEWFIALREGGSDKLINRKQDFFPGIRSYWINFLVYCCCEQCFICLKALWTESASPSEDEEIISCVVCYTWLEVALINFQWEIEVLEESWSNSTSCAGEWL